MPALIRLVWPDCVDGGLAPADCMSSRLHGGLLPTVFTAVLCRLCSRRPLANCVHGGNQPTVFTAACIRLCLCSRRIHADCVHGGFMLTVHGGFQPIVYATASCRLRSRRQGAPLTPSSTSSSHYNAATLCVLVLKNDRAVLLTVTTVPVWDFECVSVHFDDGMVCLRRFKGSKQFKGVFFRSHGCKHLGSIFHHAVGILVQVQGRAGQPTSGEIAFIRQNRGRRMAFGGRGRWEVFVNGSLMYLRDFALCGQGCQKTSVEFWPGEFSIWVFPV